MRQVACHGARDPPSWDMYVTCHQLHYFKKGDDYRDGKTPLGSLECSGATVFLKEVKGQTFRFTVPARLHYFVQDTICVRQYSVY